MLVFIFNVFYILDDGGGDPAGGELAGGGELPSFSPVLTVIRRVLCVFIYNVLYIF